MRGRHESRRHLPDRERTYRERVVPRRDGTARARITYAAAAGAQVVVDGTDAVTGWQQVQVADLDPLAANDPFLSGSPFAQGVRDGTSTGPA